MLKTLTKSQNQINCPGSQTDWLYNTQTDHLNSHQLRLQGKQPGRLSNIQKARQAVQ